MDFSNVQIEPLFEDYVDFETFSKSDFRAVKYLNAKQFLRVKSFSNSFWMMVQVYIGLF